MGSSFAKPRDEDQRTEPGQRDEPVGGSLGPDPVSTVPDTGPETRPSQAGWSLSAPAVLQGLRQEPAVDPLDRVGRSMLNDLIGIHGQEQLEEWATMGLPGQPADPSTVGATASQSGDPSVSPTESTRPSSSGTASSVTASSVSDATAEDRTLEASATSSVPESQGNASADESASAHGIDLDSSQHVRELLAYDPATDRSSDRTTR